MSTPLTPPSPLMSITEIHDFFQELGLSVSVEELKNPSTETISKTMMLIIETYMEPSRTSLKTAPLQATQHLDPHPELFEQAINEMEIYQNILEFCFQIGVETISLRNLLYPEAAPARVIWSSAINFALFRSEHTKIYEEYEARTMDMLETKDKLEEELISLTPEVERLKASFAKTAPIIKGREAEIEELKETVARLNKEQNALKEESKGIKEEIQYVNDKMANDKFNFHNSQQQCDQLRAKIVKSPEKLKGRLAQMKLDRAQKTKELNERNEYLSDLRTHGTILSKVNGKLEKRFVTLRDCEDVKKKGKDLRQEVKLKIKDYQKAEEEFLALKDAATHIDKQFSSCQGKLESLQRQTGQRRIKALQALDEAERKRAERKFSIKQDLDQDEENLAIIQRKERDLARLREEHQSEMAELQRHYMQLVKSVRTYHAEIRAACN